jgi:hypothetical protein
MKNSDSAFAIMILCLIATSVTQNHWIPVLTVYWAFVWGYRWIIKGN